MAVVLSEIVSAITGSLAVSIVVKATVVAGAALLVGRFASKRRASVRHLVFAAAFTMLLVGPIAVVFIPAINVPISTSAFYERLDLPVVTETVPSRLERTPPPVFTSAVPRVRSHAAISDLLLAVWLIGLAVSLLPVFVGLWQLRSIRRSGLPWLRGREGMRALAERAGIREPAVLLHESVAGPMTCGILHPTILFPPDVETWADVDVRRAMIHELEHVRRRDWIVQCIARSVCSFYWFHPLVWTAWRYLSLEAERACDDAVVEYGEPVGYAEQLVTLAQQLLSNTNRAVLAMADRRDLRARVMALLDTRQERGRAGKFEVISVKPGNPESRGFGGVQFSPGRAFGTNVPLSFAINVAYNLSWKQLQGDSPILDEKFDIDARTAPNAISQDAPIPERNEQLRLMLQTLLADRFKLIVHKETKDLPIYAIVVGKNGPKLKPAKETCSAEHPCDGGGGPARGLIIRDGEVSRLADFLTVFMDRIVVDRTGIKGHFDIDLPSWNPSPQTGTQVILDGHEAAPNPTDATIFTVVQEQLGLRIESTHGPVDLYVVDHVERPTPD
jgi:bla regulator protein BlaR1